MVKVAPRALGIEYAIRDVVVKAKDLERRGKKIIYLNIGDPCKFDFQPPRHMIDALYKAAIEGYNGYTDSLGIPDLREAIAEKERKVNGVKIEPDDVIVTSGISEAIFMLMGAVVEPGDEVLVPGPTYPPYISLVKYFGGIPVTYHCDEDNEWQPDVSDIEKKITERTVMIVIINPNNPTGAVYDQKILREILDLAAEHDIIVVSDEIYDRIIFDGKHVSAASVAKDVPIIGLNGFSKVYLVPGWRLGYIYFYDPEGRLERLKEAITKEARVRICANSIVQMAAVQALRGPQDHIAEMVRKLRERRDFVWRRLNEIDGLSCVKPKGAFYAFPKIEVKGIWRSDKDFVFELLEEAGVLVVFGSGFDPIYGKDHFRIVFLPPIEILKEALSKIEAFIEKKISKL
ncbi:MAG: aminotransferase class I/II-fold pyridoxal phosphate-dependent enzyme [Candidatus Baldrarchaeia archaeon]